MVLTRAPFDRFEVSSRRCALLRSALFHFRPCPAARIAAPDAVPYWANVSGTNARKDLPCPPRHERTNALSWLHPGLFDNE